MALCLAVSLVARRDFVPYDQLVRYKWWHKNGYMSSTGNCFDIGKSTKESIDTFEKRQMEFSKQHRIPFKEIDFLSDDRLLEAFNSKCGSERSAGNGALMRLAPVPLFFHRFPEIAVEYSGISGAITHGDRKAIDACRYYGALMVAVMQGITKEDLLSTKFYNSHIKGWLNKRNLDEKIDTVAKGSFKKKGYDDGIRGNGYVVSALEAALWAFWSTNTFDEGALEAINLGDDTDTTGAIYGQLAGAYYGYNAIRSDWINSVYAKEFIKCLCEWIAYESEQWHPKR